MFLRTYPALSLSPREKAIYHASTQMNVKSVNFEGIFNFRFGTGEDENLIVNLTEFIDSKMYAGGDNRGDSDGRSSDDLNVQLEPSVQLDPETTQDPSIEPIIVAHMAGGRLSMSWIKYDITHAPFAIGSRI